MMPKNGIKVVPLGAGRDVGRSCILLSIGGCNVMLDCGMHMGYTDHRRFPDFTYISRSGDFDHVIDCVIISHFHLDHVGALPHFTEVCGYNGPVYMTYPTRAICPILLEDMRRIMVDRKGDAQFFTSEDIKNCMRKVTAVDLRQTTWVTPKLSIKAFHAGHVVGAAMFLVQVGEDSVLYTGDFNMTPDRHLGAARVEKLYPTLLITETTYATTVRKSRRARERELLQQIHECVKNGGKALIPVFALGRVQELCILIEDYWDRTDDLRGIVPVYFSAGLAGHAMQYYSLFINWTNDRIKRASVDRNVFNFEHIKVYQPQFVDDPGPMVLFASPGMLHAGTSLDVFKKWCGDPKNMVILPGYCVAGTIGARVLAGNKSIEVDRFTTLNVRLTVKNLSFSAHADSKGIMQLIRACEPKYVILVHGEASKMGVLKERIHSELKIPCIDPANGETVYMDSANYVKCHMSLPLASSVWLRSSFPPGLSAPRLPQAQVKTDFASNSKRHPKTRSPKKPKLSGRDLSHGPTTGVGAKATRSTTCDIHAVLQYTTPPGPGHSQSPLPNAGQGLIRLLSTDTVSGGPGGITVMHRLKCTADCDGLFCKTIQDRRHQARSAPASHRHLAMQASEDDNSLYGRAKHEALNEIALTLATTFPNFCVERDAGTKVVKLRPGPDDGEIIISFTEAPEIGAIVEWPSALEYSVWEVISIVENVIG